MAVANLNLPAFPTFDLTDIDLNAHVENAMEEIFETFYYFVQGYWSYRWGQKLSMLLTYI